MHGHTITRHTAFDACIHTAVARRFPSMIPPPPLHCSIAAVSLAASTWVPMPVCVSVHVHNTQQHLLSAPAPVTSTATSTSTAHFRIPIRVCARSSASANSLLCAGLHALCLGAAAEVVLEATRQRAQVAHAAGAIGASALGLGTPVVCSSSKERRASKGKRHASERIVSKVRVCVGGCGWRTSAHLSGGVAT